MSQSERVFCPYPGNSCNPKGYAGYGYLNNHIWRDHRGQLIYHEHAHAIQSGQAAGYCNLPGCATAGVWRINNADPREYFTHVENCAPRSEAQRATARHTSRRGPPPGTQTSAAGPQNPQAPQLSQQSLGAQMSRYRGPQPGRPPMQPPSQSYSTPASSSRTSPPRPTRRPTTPAPPTPAGQLYQQHGNFPQTATPQQAGRGGQGDRPWPPPEAGTGPIHPKGYYKQGGSTYGGPGAQ